MAAGIKRLEEFETSNGKTELSNCTEEVWGERSGRALRLQQGNREEEGSTGTRGGCAGGSKESGHGRQAEGVREQEES